MADAIGARQLHPENTGNWAIVILDACFSRDFARAVHIHLLTHHPDAKQYLLLSTAAEGYAELGAFTHALDRALSSAFLDRDAIGLVELGSELARDLDGYRADTADDRHTRLVNRETLSAFSSSLDQRAELVAVINELPIDERRHFLPKASGAELGELAWHFHGRTVQRDHILRWLAAGTTGTLVVTGPAGAGKSALLGHILLHTNPRLRDILIRQGHLTPLPAGNACPDDPFDLVVHLSGLTLGHIIGLIATAAGLTRLAEQAATGRAADLTSRLITELDTRQARLTVLFDALDEAEQPLLLADRLLRPLAALPGVRIVVGTRRSTHEGPDHPAPTDTNLLHALRPRPIAGVPRPGLDVVEVDHDPEALAGYLRSKLTAAQHRGTLETDDAGIATAVHRLVAEHPRDNEQQQFLYARLAAHELLNDPNLITDPTPLIGQTHRQLFTHALERLRRIDRRYTLLLQALGLAQGRGLPDQDRIWATAADALHTGLTDTRDVIPALLRDAAPYLALDQEHGQSVYRLAHRTFTEHFTTQPTAARAHAAIATALIHHTTRSLQPRIEPTVAEVQVPVPVTAISPYTRHHLAAHARLGHTAGALKALADHPHVLDALDLTSITTAVLHHGLAPRDLPLAIAGSVLLQHHAHETSAAQPADATAWRKWWRRLGTTYIQGTPPPAEPPLHGTDPSLPTLIGGTVSPRQPHLQLAGHGGRVHALAVFTAPDGTPRLATLGSDNTLRGTLRIWDPITGEQVGEPLTVQPSLGAALAVFTAPDGAPRVAIVGHDSTMWIYDPATGVQGDKIRTAHTWMAALAVFTAPDGTPRLAIAGFDRTVRIWDPAAGVQVGEIHTGHTDHSGRVGWATALAAFTAPDGTPRLAIPGDSGTVWIWDPVTGVQVGEPLTGHTPMVYALAVFTAPDGTPRLAIPGDDRTVRIWDPATGVQVGEIRTAHTSRVYAMAVFTAPDGTLHLTTVGDDHKVRIWDPATGVQVGEPLTGYTSAVRALAVLYAPLGTPHIATAGDALMVRIWDPTTKVQVGEPLTDYTTKGTALAVFTAPDGTPRIAIPCADHVVRIWGLTTGTQVDEFHTGQTDLVRRIVVFTAPDGTPRLATAGNHDDTVRIWDPTTGTQIGSFLTGHPGSVSALTVFTAPDAAPRLVTAGYDHMVRIWDPTTRVQVSAIRTARSSWVSALTVFTANDGSPRLAIPYKNHTVRIWDPINRVRVGAPLTGHTALVTAVAVFTATDGTVRLATFGNDRTVRIWDPIAGGEVGAPLVNHKIWVDEVAVFTAPDGTPRLAAPDFDHTVRIWDPQAHTVYALPLAVRSTSLVADHGLLVAGTSSGHFVIDFSSIPAT
ncbi:hypothetical protein ACFXDJ_03955 [Streptomyces sp. NPDC059443]|uniref:hypothetical protein n=1 Tax=Streptomyces sp. NPDC059443 TaxID=3346831 RepID=UPI0036C337C0